MPEQMPMFNVRLFMAGDAKDAIAVIARFCTRIGWCVTLTPTTYIYSGGQESGFVVHAIAYARFRDQTEEDATNRMRSLARRLCASLGQRSYSICTDGKSEYVSRQLPFETGNPTP